MPGTEYYMSFSSVEENLRQRNRERDMLNLALKEIQDFYTYNPGRQWTFKLIGGDELMKQIIDNIKARLYDLR